MNSKKNPYNVPTSKKYSSHLRHPPFLPVHEEEVLVDDVLDAVGEEVGEVVEVLDADLLQELNVSDKDSGLGSSV